MLAENKIPVIAVITKADEDKGFSKIVKEKLPFASSVVRVRAIEKHIRRINKTIPPMGLMDLINKTLKVIPEGK